MLFCLPTKNRTTEILTVLLFYSRKTCSKKNLYKKVPILSWLPKYDVETGVADLIAGLTVGLTVIPQGMYCSKFCQDSESVQF